MASRKADKLVTIKDVASRAGVSAMTVSRVVHDPDSVAEKKREHVRSVIEELGYIPDLAAGSLASKRSRTVAVILPSLHFEGHMRTVEALSKTLRANGYHLLIADNFYSPTEEMELLRALLGRRPAAVVMINSAHSPEGRRLLKNAGIMVVETWDFPLHPMDTVVGFSHAAVGSALTEHLVTQGFKRIVFLGGPQHIDPRGHERRLGFESTMQAHGLDASRQLIINTDHLAITAGREGIVRMLNTYPDTEAMICLTDRVAMGALMECRRRHIHVPDQLAITGHGGFDFSEHLTPSLTTTHIDAPLIGRRAAELLLERLNKKSTAEDRQRLDIGFTVIARESTLVNR